MEHWSSTSFTPIIDDIVNLGKTLMQVAIGVWEYLNMPADNNLIYVVFRDVDFPSWFSYVVGIAHQSLTSFLAIPYGLANNGAFPTHLQLILFYVPLLVVAPLATWIWSAIKHLF